MEYNKYEIIAKVEIKADRERGMSYKDLMEKYHISSKGTMSNIINKR